MKRAVLFVVIALLGGLALGALFGSGMSSAAQAMARGATPAEAILAAAPSVPASPSAAVSTPGTQPAPDTDRLLERAARVLETLSDRDFQALSRLVHPERGVTLTPYSTVSDCDRVLLPQQVSSLESDEEVYTWGLEDGIGSLSVSPGRSILTAMSITPTTPPRRSRGWTRCSCRATPWRTF